MEINENTCKPIILTYLNGTGYIFNADDYMEIRTKWRIVGTLFGKHSAKGWSSNVKGLPAEYNQWETQLLLENGIVTLSKKSKYLKSLSEIDIAEYKKEVSMNIKEQSKYFKSGVVNASKKNIDKIVTGKIKKLLNSGITQKNIYLGNDQIIKKIDENFAFNKDNAITEVPMQHPQKYESENIQLQILNSLKYRIFKDLWIKNKYITSGETFGGDFLVYPGDPMLFHASHIIIILDKPRISPTEFVAKCRLSIIVKKFCVFAFLNLKDEINYQTVNWKK